MAYCTWTDIELWFGKNAAAAMAAFDGDATLTTSRKTRCITAADAQIDAVLRTTRYANRLPIADANGTTPPLIVDISASLAGVWLYDSQGVRDKDKEGRPYHNWEFRRQWAMERLEDIRTGKILLDAVD